MEVSGQLNTLAIYLFKRTKLQGQVKLGNHFDIISSYVNANCMEIRTVCQTFTEDSKL
jgi:hypothetical protein